MRVRLQGRFNEDAEIFPLGFLTICSPLPRAVELYLFPQLQELELAVCVQSKETDREILANDIFISSDFYWEIVSGNIA